MAYFAWIFFTSHEAPKQMTKKTRARGVAAAAAVLAGLPILLFAGCSEQPSDDRTNKSADGFEDATKVVIVKNADQVPNIALFCADGLRFAATLSSDGAKQPQLVRVPEQDSMCSGR